MPPASTPTRTCVLYLHGLNDYDRDRNLEQLSEGFRHYVSTHNLGFVAQSSALENGELCTRFRARDGSREIDLQLVYIGDLRRSFATLSVLAKLKQGGAMLIYWLASPLWGQLLRTQQSRLLAGVVGTLTIFGLWYAATLITIASAPNDLPDAIQGPLRQFAETVKSVWIWVVLLALLQALPVNLMMDVVRTATSYLDDPDLAQRMRMRLSGPLSRADRNGSYDEIVLVAHSFGGVIAVDVLDSFRFTAPARVLTLGSPVELIAVHRRPFREALDRALTNPTINRWDDVDASGDWLCTPIPAPEDRTRFHSHRLRPAASLRDRLNGNAHEVYFYEDAVYQLLLDPGAPTGATSVP